MMRVSRWRLRYSIYVVEGPDGPCYVGCTSRPVEARFAAHKTRARGRSSKQPLHVEMRVRGVELFSVREVAQATDAHNGVETETDVIEQYRADGVRLFNATHHTHESARVSLRARGLI